MLFKEELLPWPAPFVAGPGDNTAGPGEHTAGPGEHTAGPGEHTAGPGDNTTGPGDNTAGPGEHTAGPGEHTAGPGDNTAGPGDNTAEPGDNTAEPGDNTAEPGDNTAGPGDNTAGPGDNTTGPGRNEPKGWPRERIVASLSENMRLFWNGGPLVVLGDFNAHPFDREIALRTSLWATRDKIDLDDERNPIPERHDFGMDIFHQGKTYAGRDDLADVKSFQKLRPLYNPMWRWLPEATRTRAARTTGKMTTAW